MTQHSTSFPSRLEAGDVLGGRYVLVSPIAFEGAETVRLPSNRIALSSNARRAAS